MTETSPGHGSRLLECGAAASLLLWRILARPSAEILIDWVALLAIYWIYTVFASRSRAWPFVTAAAMVLLGAIYVHGRFPHTLASLGIGS